MPLFGKRLPFQDEIDDLAAEFEHLRFAESERLERYRRYRQECEETREFAEERLDHWSEDYKRKVLRDPELSRHNFKFPFAQALTVKHAYRVAGRLPDVVVERRAESREERWRSDVMEKIWWGVSRESNGEVQFADAAWDSSQVGAAPFELYYDVKRQIPVYRAYDPAGCLVVSGYSDPHDFERIYRFWETPLTSLVAKYREAEFRGLPVSVQDIDADGQSRKVTIVQTSDRRKTMRFALGLTKGAKHVPLEEFTHGLGFVPNVVIPNLGPYRKIWGWADYEFVREITRYIPMLFGREADILRMVANGAMKARGTKVTPRQIKEILQAGGVIPVGRDGDIEPVQAPDVPAFAGEHQERAFQILERLGFAPPAAWGAIGAQSGSDRGLQLQPMVELTAMKQKNWAAGLSRMASMVYQMVEKKQVEARSYRGVAARGPRRTPFNITLGPALDPQLLSDPETGELISELPRDPKQIFDGDYSASFQFADRIDYDDPSYVASELNKFAQNAQSLHTTLERLGIQSPEDEIRLMEREAEEHPWIRQGMLKMMELAAGASQQGEGGGPGFDSAGALGGALDTMNSKDGSALDADALSGSLDGGIGTLFGQA